MQYQTHRESPLDGRWKRHCQNRCRVEWHARGGCYDRLCGGLACSAAIEKSGGLRLRVLQQLHIEVQLHAEGGQSQCQ